MFVTISENHVLFFRFISFLFLVVLPMQLQLFQQGQIFFFLASPTLDPYNYHTLLVNPPKMFLNIFLVLFIKSVLSSLLIVIITNAASFETP